MKNPIKCTCGKMINYTKSNKSGLCSACSMRESYKRRYKKNKKIVERRKPKQEGKIE